MNSINFRTIPLNTLEKIMQFGEFFENALQSKVLATDYLQDSTLFAFTDHTKKGLKYVSQIQANTLIRTRAYQNDLGCPGDEVEIFEMLKKKGLVQEAYFQTKISFEPTCPTVLQERNARLEEICSSFSWIERGKFFAREENLIIVKLEIKK